MLLTKHESGYYLPARIIFQTGIGLLFTSICQTGMVDRLPAAGGLLALFVGELPLWSGSSGASRSYETDEAANNDAADTVALAFFLVVWRCGLVVTAASSSSGGHLLYRRAVLQQHATV